MKTQVQREELRVLTMVNAAEGTVADLLIKLTIPLTHMVFDILRRKPVVFWYNTTLSSSTKLLYDTGV